MIPAEPRAAHTGDSGTARGPIRRAVLACLAAAFLLMGLPAAASVVRDGPSAATQAGSARPGAHQDTAAAVPTQGRAPALLVHASAQAKATRADLLGHGWSGKDGLAVLPGSPAYGGQVNAGAAESPIHGSATDPTWSAFQGRAPPA